MKKARKIKYSNYKHQAYKLLNKLFLEELLRRGGFMLPTGYRVRNSDNLEFKIMHNIPSKEYHIGVYLSGYVVCMVTAYATTSNWFYVSSGSLYPTDVDPVFVKKVLTPVKELMKYSLPENVVTVKFYADNDQIAYGRRDSSGKVIEAGRSSNFRGFLTVLM